MAITSAICDSYLQEIYSGVHTDTDTYMIALYVESATLGATTTGYTIDGEATGTGYTAGGLTLSGFNTSIDGGVSILDFTSDPTWNNCEITARGALIYNATKSNKAVAVLDFGSSLTASGGDFVIEFPAANASSGLIRIS
jgi:hypothetical protein